MTPLHAEHLKLGARMVPFAGWDMPVQYQSILQEHRAVRVAVGAFDVSHMGEFEIAGPGALAFLQWLTPNDVSTIAVGGSQYSCLLQPDAGMIDDIFMYRLDDRYLMVVNASNIDRVGDWLAANRRADVTVRNRSAETGLIAVQGPLAISTVQNLVAGDLSSLPRRGIRSDEVAGVRSLIGRTGYTGEDGVEIFCAASEVARVWRAVLDGGTRPVQPCGLGARDTLRLEAGNLLYGHDMDERTNPLEAGLSFVVKLAKGDFVGRGALTKAKAEGLRRRLVGFEMVERGVPRSGFSVEVDGRPVGQVTSGSYAPTLDRNVGLAYVEAPLATVDRRIDVVIRERPVPAKIVKLPFYRSPSRSVGA
ncbi:MAG: glycine cleavage system aminomethyltransferase GcvT [Chloroflexota bacterium]